MHIAGKPEMQRGCGEERPNVQGGPRVTSHKIYDGPKERKASWLGEVIYLRGFPVYIFESTHTK